MPTYTFNEKPKYIHDRQMLFVDKCDGFFRICTVIDEIYEIAEGVAIQPVIQLQVVVDQVTIGHNLYPLAQMLWLNQQAMKNLVAKYVPIPLPPELKGRFEK